MSNTVGQTPVTVPFASRVRQVISTYHCSRDEGLIHGPVRAFLHGGVPSPVHFRFCGVLGVCAAAPMQLLSGPCAAATTVRASYSLVGRVAEVSAHCGVVPTERPAYVDSRDASGLVFSTPTRLDAVDEEDEQDEEAVDKEDDQDKDALDEEKGDDDAAEEPVDSSDVVEKEIVYGADNRAVGRLDDPLNGALWQRASL